MNKRYLDRPFEVKSVQNDGTFAGYGSVFGVEDSYREVVARGAFGESLGEWRKKGRMPALLWQHRPDQPIGVYTDMAEDERGLHVEGQLALDTQLGREAHSLLKMDALSGLSIGFMPKEWETDREAGITTLTKVDLWEVSLVTFPANDEARIQQVRAALSEGELPTEREFELILRDAGFSRRQAKTIVAAGYRAVRRDDDAELEELTGAIQRLITIMQE